MVEVAPHKTGNFNEDQLMEMELFSLEKKRLSGTSLFFTNPLQEGSAR